MSIYQTDKFSEMMNQEECDKCLNKEELYEYCTRNGGKQGCFLEIK